MPGNATLMSAFHSNQLGFAFSDSGWLLPWYIGVFGLLKATGIIKPGVTPVGGVSGGAIIAAAECLLQPGDKHSLMSTVQDAAAACRGRAMCAFSLSSQLRPRLQTALVDNTQQQQQQLQEEEEEEAALRRCNVSTFLFVSRGRPLLGSTPELIDSSHGIQNFLAGVLATSHIPFWSDGSATTTYQGRPAYEGFYSLPMPCPPTAAVCVRLSARAAGRQVARGPVWQRVLLWLLQLVLRGAPPMPQPGDLTPGMYRPLPRSGGPRDKAPPISVFELGYQLALLPGNPRVLQGLIEHGVYDAAAWAQETGLLAAAAAAARAAAADSVEDSATVSSAGVPEDVSRQAVATASVEARPGSCQQAGSAGVDSQECSSSSCSRRHGGAGAAAAGGGGAEC